MFISLRKKVLKANKELGNSGLVKLNWGNISEIDRKNNVIAIKPSGVNYKKMSLKDIPVIKLNGLQIFGKLKPSTDLHTHLELYRNFKEINGICHTHSTYATIFSQAAKSIPCIGTTHADYFDGDIPITKILDNSKVRSNYVKNVGRSIVETIKFKKINILNMPAILVANHGPFVFSKNAAKALEIAIVLEEVANMCYKSFQLKKKIVFKKSLLNQHFQRKNGAKKYYGQK